MHASLLRVIPYPFIENLWVTLTDQILHTCKLCGFMKGMKLQQFLTYRQGVDK